MALAVFTACDEDDNPVDDGDPVNTNAVYVSFDQNSYWVYDSETYDDPDGNNMTERDSTVVTSTDDYDGRASYQYTTWTEVEGTYESEPSSVEYYSESEGDVYLHASSINDRLATEEVKAIIDFSLPDGWLMIRDADNTSTRVIQEVNIDDTEINVGVVSGTLKNGKLTVEAKTAGSENVEQPNGNMINSDKVELKFVLTGDVESTLANGTLSGEANYTVWMADGVGITKTDFSPFTATVSALNQSFEVFKAAGTRNVLVRSQVSQEVQ